MFRKSLIACCVAALFACSTVPASAGLFCNKKADCCEPCCDPCCDPAPVCCDPAPVCCEPAPVCCEPAPVCCPPPAPRMVPSTVCIVDPCTGCSKLVDVCIPECCCGEKPSISCRKGLFGRKIYSVCWNCCGHEVTVIITRRGKCIVK